MKPLKAKLLYKLRCVKDFCQCFLEKTIIAMLRVKKSKVSTVSFVTTSKLGRCQLSVAANCPNEASCMIPMFPHHYFQADC